MSKSKAKRSPRSKSWIFVDFTLKKFAEDETRKGFQYLCYGLEKCPRSGKMHHQGFAQTLSATSLRSVQRMLGLPGCHLEAMRASPEEAVFYCKKDGVFTEYGVLTHQGQRSDIDAVKALIEGGSGPKEIADANFQLFCQYSKGLERYREVVVQLSTKAFRRVSVVIIRGETGTGKTRFASRYATFRIGGHDLKWWDGYNQERCILIDEYANDIPISKLLSLLDGYQQRLPIKGGFTYANWTSVFITTNLANLHDQARPAHRRALRRRITLELDFPLI